VMQVGCLLCGREPHLRAGGPLRWHTLAMMGAPSGTVILLFTDIEGPTCLWQMDEAAMGVAVSRPAELLRAALQDCGGKVFSTMVSGFAAANR
jgi:hypothetical protein